MYFAHLQLVNGIDSLLLSGEQHRDLLRGVDPLRVLRLDFEEAEIRYETIEWIDIEVADGGDVHTPVPVRRVFGKAA